MSLPQMCGFWMLLALATPGPAVAQPAEDAVELESITVTPQINPLDASMERLRNMMEDAPCLGCGPVQDAARENVYLKYGSYLSFLTGAGLEPPNPSAEERVEARVAGDWRQYERDPVR